MTAHPAWGATDRSAGPMNDQPCRSASPMKHPTMKTPPWFWLVYLLSAVAAMAATPTRPPNIVFFLADDLGQRDLAVYGSSFYETPNLDRLAKEGALFTDAYAACPVCSPTRASILSGQWPQRTGITDYIGAPATPEAWKRNTKMLPAPYADRLALDAPTLAKAMKSAGYATFFAGKWHLGPEGWWPENQGFDHNLGGIDRGGPYGGKKYFSPYGNPRLKDGPDGEHLPDRLATETANFIAANRERPFFAYYSFYDVHTPLMARPDLLRKYEEKRARLGLKEAWGREHERDVRLIQEHAVYAAMVEAMDLAVGKVLAKLDELGLRENTLVIFTSDNGGLSTSEGWPTSNLPFRGGKGWMYEGGIREPLLVRWPGMIKPGLVVSTPVSSPDFFPTLLEAAAAKPAPGQKIDGVSLLPLLQGKALSERALFWHYPHYGNQGSAPAAAIRRGPWKLIHWAEDDRVELFRLDQDPGETVDLAAREPQRVASLRAELTGWQRDVGAKFPVPNPAYDPAKPSGRASVRPGATANR
jgi:arylsulfatase A-like enzyme